MNGFIFKALLPLWQRISAEKQQKLINWHRNKKKHAGMSLTPEMPFTAVIDTTNICNLDCPLCASKNQNFEKGAMSLDTFKMVLDKIPSVGLVILFNWGEPFLNLRIFDIIKLAVSRNIYTITHTNFSLKRKDKFFEDIINSGLHQLILSIDGATQENYSKYRVGGDVELVLDNIRRLVDAKKRLGKRDPKIVWKFLINRWNEHEVPMAQKYCDEFGIELITEPMGLGDDLPDFKFDASLKERRDMWLPKDDKYVLPIYKDEEKYEYPFVNAPCQSLFGTTVINYDGRVTPCCWVTDKENVFGDLKDSSFEEIWNNDKYQYSRGLFLDKPFHKEMRTVCSTCEIFDRKHGIFKNQEADIPMVNPISKIEFEGGFVKV